MHQTWNYFFADGKKILKQCVFWTKNTFLLKEARFTRKLVWALKHCQDCPKHVGTPIMKPDTVRILYDCCSRSGHGPHKSFWHDGTIVLLNHYTLVYTTHESRAQFYLRHNGCFKKVVQITQGSKKVMKLLFNFRVFEKSNFCPKIQFWQNPNIFTSFSPNVF